MNNQDGKIYYGLGLDNSQLQEDANQSMAIIKGIGNQAEAEGARIDNIFNKVSKSVGISLAGISVGSFVKQMFQIRSEFQDTESSMRVFLGSADKAAKFMQELQDYAWYNMFEFSDLTSESAKLLAFGNDVENVIPILDKLSNVAAGTKQPLGDLVDLYNKAKSIGKVDAMGLESWGARGVVITDVLKEMGVEVDRSSVKFEHLEMVLNHVTSSGGLFNGLMNEQMSNLSASYGQLQDDITNMFNELGIKSQDAMKQGIEFASVLVDNYEKIGRTVLELVAVYGTYRTALAVVSALQKTYTLLQLETALAGTKLSVAQSLQALTIKGLQRAWMQLNATMLANPYILVAAGITTLAYGIYKLTTYQTEAEKGQKRLNDAIKESEKASLGETRELARLKGELSAATKGSEEYNSIKEKIVSNYGKYHNGLADEIEKVGLLDSTYKKLTESIQASFAARQYEKFQQAESDNLDEVMSKNLGKIQDKLIDKLGDEAGSKYYAKIREAIFNGGVSIDAGFKATGLDPETQAALDKISGKSGDDWIKNYAVEGYIKNILTAQKLTDDLDKKARIKFGIDGDTGSTEGGGTDGGTIQAQRYGEAYEAAKKEWEDSKKALSEIEKDKDSFTKEQYENAKKREDTAKKIYADLGGIVSTKTTGSTSKPKDYTDQLKREETEKIRFYKDLEFAVRQAEIDASDEGLGKVLAQNELNYQKEIEQVKRQKEDKLAKIQDWERTIWEAENPDWEKKGMKFSPTTTKLSDDDNEQFNTIEASALKKFEDDNKKALENIINLYGDYYQKRELLAEQWEKKIAGLPLEFQAEANAKMHRELADLDSSYIKTTSAISKLFEDTATKSVSEIRRIANEAEQMKDFVLGGTWDAGKGADFGITESQFKALNEEWSKSPEKLEAIKKGIRALHAEANNSENAFQKLSRGLKNVFSAGKDEETLKNSFADIQDGLEQIGGLAQDVGNNVATIFSAFGNDEAAEMASNITNLVGGVGEIGSGVAQLASGNILGGIQSLASGITSVVNSIARLHDAKKEKEIQRLQKQVDALEAAYEKLGKSIEKAYSANAANLIKQQDANLRQQKKLLEEQIRLEEEKKKTDKNKVQQYKDAIKEIDDALAETQDRVIEAIIGQDVSSAIDEFANAYIDAWAAGEDKAASMKEVVRKMIKSAVTELVKSRLSPEVTAFMEYLATAMEDGILTVAEQNTLDALENAIYNKLNGLDESLDKYVKDKQEDERTGSKRGIATASQESVDENNGRLTAIQGHTYSLTENMKILVSNTGAILILLSGIEENTKGISRLEKIEKDMGSVKDTINDIALKGLILKK